MIKLEAKLLRVIKYNKLPNKIWGNQKNNKVHKLRSFHVSQSIHTLVDCLKQYNQAIANDYNKKQHIESV